MGCVLSNKVRFSGRETMKAAVYYENGGPEVLKYEDVPDPVCHKDKGK